MRVARGKYYAFLDPDDYWRENHLEHMLARIGDADLFCCSMRSVDASGADLGPHMGSRMTGLMAGFPGSLYEENFLLPSATCLHRKVFERTGGFSSYRHAADWDFYLRCVSEGLRFEFSPEENCFYRRHEHSATRNYLTMTQAAADVLRCNYKASGGTARRALRESLRKHLIRLAYLQISFRYRTGIGTAARAFAMKPFDADLYGEIRKSLRNNWSDLRDRSASPLPAGKDCGA